MLDRIINETLNAIEHSKEDIFEIAEAAKGEQRRLQNDLENLRNELKHVIDQVDRLELMYRRSRVRLMEVSRDFNKYTERISMLPMKMPRRSNNWLWNGKRSKTCVSAGMNWNGPLPAWTIW